MRKKGPGVEYVSVAGKRKYKTPGAVLRGINALIRKRVKVTTTTAVCKGRHQDQALFRASRKFFGSWANAVVAAEEKRRKK